MVMDRNFSELYDSTNGLELSSDSKPSDRDPHEDFDFSDVVLKYISEMLMEEDMEEKGCMFQESAALQAQEQSLYELIGKEYPSRGNIASASMASASASATSTRGVSVSQSSYSSSSGTVDGVLDSPISTLRALEEEPFSETQNDSIVQFKRAFEEASKLIPKVNSLIVDSWARGKKNPFHGEREDFSPQEGKKSAVSVDDDSNISSEMFDMILLNCGKDNKKDLSLRPVLQNGSPRAARGKKTHGGRKNVVDLRTLLTLCAQSVAANDQRTAEEYLKQIRQNSSQTGDGMQRLAQCFADGLEARMAGSGTQVYRALLAKPTSAATVLKAYHLYLQACPFKKLSNFFANKTIMNLAAQATQDGGPPTLHIVDLGILYGFPWPCLIQRLSTRPGGPPRLRITGIDFPQPGFRPAERVEETGRRLAKYAETFKVPFEFNAIAKKWDTITIDELKLEKGEILVVNCMHRMRNLLDETVVVDCPRNIVLNLVREMDPAVFLLGTVNGAYNAPFFVTRFREALFHFSTLFDMLDTNVGREVAERTMIEREIFGREAMNVIACEGSERIERPETYRQWMVRMGRAGFYQLPLDREIVQLAEDRVRSSYHKDFMIDQDGDWLLQGWKGRIVYTLSSWASRRP